MQNQELGDVHENEAKAIPDDRRTRNAAVPRVDVLSDDMVPCDDDESSPNDDGESLPDRDEFMSASESDRDEFMDIPIPDHNDSVTAGETPKKHGTREQSPQSQLPYGGLEIGKALRETAKIAQPNDRMRHLMTLVDLGPHSHGPSKT